MIFNDVLRDVKKNKEVILKGGYNCIPWPLKRFSNHIPGIQQGRLFITTANSKIGKTNLTDFLFMYGPYNFIKSRKCNLSLKIFYFSLEISKREKIKQAIVHKIFTDTGKILSRDMLESMFSDKMLDDETEKLVESYHPYFEEFEKTVTFIDNIRNPFGIYKYMRDYAHSNGKYHDKNNKVISTHLIETGNEDAVKSIDKYVPDNPDEYVIIITDHVSLLFPEKGETLHQAMSKFSSNYCLKMRDRWNYTIVNVQQQSADQEKQQYTFSGNPIIEKVKPSADGLGDNKLVGRDCDVMLGLFSPYRYKIKDYEGYDITKLRDNFRELSVILNRRGTGFVDVPLYFNGAVSYFEELPKSHEMTIETYKKYVNYDKSKDLFMSW